MQQQAATLSIPKSIENLLSNLETNITAVDECQETLVKLNNDGLEINKELGEQINAIIEKGVEDGEYVVKSSNGLDWRVVINDGFLDVLEPVNYTALQNSIN